MKIQKLIALLLALVMVLALAACGNDDAKKSDDDSDPTNSTTAPAGDPTDPEDPEDPTDPVDPVDPTDDPDDLNGLEQQIIGNWTATVSITGEKMQLPAFTGALEMTVNYTFREDHTGSASLDTDAFAASVESNRQDLADALVQLLYDQLGGQEAAEQTCQNNLGMSCAEYADTYVDTMKTSLTSSFQTGESGTWSITDSVLTMGETVVTVSINGDEMVWTGDENMEASLGTDTLTFNRV